MGLGQSQQVSFSRQDLPEPVAERCAQIAGLAGFLGDDQDPHGRQPDLNPSAFQPLDGEYPEPVWPSRPAMKAQLPPEQRLAQVTPHFAELAHNSWSELLQVTLVGIGAEMAQMYPERLTYSDDPEQTVAATAAQLRAVKRTDTTVLAGRTGPVGKGAR